MIEKKATLYLTQEEVDSPEPIQIKVTVETPEGSIDYTISYPKGE